MNSSPASTASPAPREGAPLAASAGAADGLPVAPDPIAAWMDLMEAVEALCPRWPDRPRPAGRDYRL